jgi:hypothetical protein
MSFKENLLKKIQINQLARKVLASFGQPESGSKIDKDAMRSILALSAYQYRKERDLDLYIEGLADEPCKILVLDNELPIYRTTVEDVVIRKSPYTKEMLKIGNIIKILKDSDVKISRKEESLKIVRQESIDRLDLAYDAADIEAIAKEGANSLENGHTEGIIESLALFAELLGYQPPPKTFRLRHHEISGVLTDRQSGETVYGPAVILSLVDHSLRMIKDEISSLDKAKIEFFHQVAQGKEKPDIEGQEVFRYLQEAVLRR